MICVIYAYFCVFADYSANENFSVRSHEWAIWFLFCNANKVYQKCNHLFLKQLSEKIYLVYHVNYDRNIKEKDINNGI